MFQDKMKLWEKKYMGGKFLSEKKALSVSLFVSFHGDLESKLAIGGPKKKYPVDKYTKDNYSMALFL